MKKEYTVRTLTKNEYSFVRFTNKRNCLKKSKQWFNEQPDILELAVFQNVIGDDFGIQYPDECKMILYRFRLVKE